MSAGPSSSNVIDLWKRSDISPEIKSATLNPVTATSGPRLSAERSVLWTNLSQMAPSDQSVVMNKLTTRWPYDNERRALAWPMHAGLIANCLTSSFIATKINADMVLMNTRLSFLESVQKGPKSPLVFGVYTSGLTYYVLEQMTVMPSIYREDDPCSSCMLTRNMCISLFTGIAMPMISTPYLCYYVMLQRQDSKKFPAIANMLEFFMLALEGSKSARPLLLKAVPLQVGVTALATYSLLWGRSRVFNTMDADPDLARELLVSAQSSPSTKEKVMGFLRKVPFLSDVITEESPENERL